MRSWRAQCQQVDNRRVSAECELLVLDRGLPGLPSRLV